VEKYCNQYLETEGEFTSHVI